ncbi:hypothetical protein BRD03_11885 [Halobacteriales archaeon QS_9_68_17]|nr:MAG: hypothetical protein BRD03_11885 [Halobacteriales archaeon QS_9_68_17]
MNRRTFLGTVSGTTGLLAGCLFTAEDETSSGTVSCGDTTHDALHDEPLDAAVTGTWESIYGDRQNTGVRPNTAGPADCPQTHWRALPPDPDDRISFDFPPVVSDGYAVISNGLSRVFAFDARSATAEWTAEVTSGITELATIGDLVCFGSGRGVHALALADGTERWCRETDDRISTAPKVDGDRLFVTTDSGTLLAIDRDGHVVWRTSVPSGDRETSTDRNPRTPAAVTGDRVFVCDSAGLVAAVDRTTGDLAWSRSFDEDVSNAPTVGADAVLVASERSLRALDRQTGETRWTAFDDASDSSVVVNSPALDVTTGTVYAQAGPDLQNLFLTAVDAGTGTERWRTGIALPETDPIVGLDHVYLGAGSDLIAVDRDSHEERWRMTQRSDIHGHPVLLDRTVFVPSVDDGLFAVA